MALIIAGKTSRPAQNQVLLVGVMTADGTALLYRRNGILQPPLARIMPKALQLDPSQSKYFFLAPPHRIVI